MGRVRIGTCSGPADAALVRAAFDAHGVRVVINAEHHAGMLGGLGGAFVPLHILVDDQDAEEASALLADLRAEPAGDDGAIPDELDGEDDSAAVDVGARVDRKRRTGVVMLLALCVTFGTAHMYAGAWLRGFVIAIIEVLAFTRMVADPRLGGILLFACIATDLVGALLSVRAERARIPEARVRR